MQVMTFFLGNSTSAVMQDSSFFSLFQSQGCWIQSVLSVVRFNHSMARNLECVSWSDLLFRIWERGDPLPSPLLTFLRN